MPRIANKKHEKKVRKRAEARESKEEEVGSSSEESSEVEEEEEHAFHEIDHIKSSRWGTKAGKKVVYYLVKFLDGTPNMLCLKDHVSSEAIEEFHAKHPNQPRD